MNNLYRELAPISDAAWSQIEDEATRTLKRHLAARRVVDVEGPAGFDLSAVGTGHVVRIEPPLEAVTAVAREVQPVVEVRAPFELDRQAIDDVERGALDSDWQPVKDAARQLAFAEDQAIFEGYPAGHIGGIRQGTSNPIATLPADVFEYPRVVAEAISQLRLVGVNGPYQAVLSADAYTRASESQRPRSSAARAYSAPGERGHHLGAGHHGRIRPEHPRRRLRAAPRPGRVDWLHEPHQTLGPAVLAGDRSRSWS